MLNPDYLDPIFVTEINCTLLNLNSPTAKFDLVESAFASIPYYNDDIDVLCSVYRSLIKNHPFFDANKRTASVYLLDGLNSLGYTIDQDVLADLTLDVAVNKYEVSDISKKLRSVMILK